MISINLLPPELAGASKKKQKNVLISQISIGVLIAMIILTTSVLGFTFAQTQISKKSQEKVTVAASEVTALKPNEEVVAVVKNRIGGISSILFQDSLQSQAFNLIYALTPKEVTLLSFTVDKGGKIGLSGETQSLPSLDAFFIALTDPTKHEGKISSVKVESLNRRLGGKIRFDLTVNLAKT